jgi:hypothetical protein
MIVAKATIQRPFEELHSENMLDDNFSAVAFVEHSHVIGPDGAPGDLAGIRWRVETRFPAIDGSG